MLQRSIRIAALLLLFILSASGAVWSWPAKVSARSLPATAAADYVLGPNDRIRLKVYGEPDIAGEYEIDSTGQVSIPLAGHQSHRPDNEAAGALDRIYAGERNRAGDPRVNVEIALYRPYYILGEVKKGGEYPYRLGLTVMDAVASAGGFTYHILPGYDRAVRPFQNGLPN
jgi:protein involved in polysaccharide export with SLBB domain